MKQIGAHVSASGGVYNAPINATKIGARAFAFFNKNQRRWDAKPLDKKTIKKFKYELEKSGVLPKYVLSHDSYLINLGDPDEVKREKSLNAFIDEINRCEQLGLDRLNFHPGSHLMKMSKKEKEDETKLGYIEEECLGKISESLNTAMEQTQNVILVIENTAGQGTNLGYKLEHLKYLIDNSNDKSRIGVCIDTCHFFVSGYDIRDKESYDKSFGEFEQLIGFEYLKGMHINDSKPPLGSKVDRHQSLGIGEIGIEFFKILMNDERIDDIPMVLETPNPEIWAEEIELLYSFVKK